MRSISPLDTDRVSRTVCISDMSGENKRALLVLPMADTVIGSMLAPIENQLVE